MLFQRDFYKALWFFGSNVGIFPYSDPVTFDLLVSVLYTLMGSSPSYRRDAAQYVPGTSSPGGLNGFHIKRDIITLFIDMAKRFTRYPKHRSLTFEDNSIDNFPAMIYIIGTYTIVKSYSSVLSKAMDILSRVFVTGNDWTRI